MLVVSVAVRAGMKTRVGVAVNVGGMAVGVPVGVLLGVGVLDAPGGGVLVMVGMGVKVAGRVMDGLGAGVKVESAETAAAVGMFTCAMTTTGSGAVWRQATTAVPINPNNSANPNQRCIGVSQSVSLSVGQSFVCRGSCQSKIQNPQSKIPTAFPQTVCGCAKRRSSRG
ncbi:MAG: hypothetical protein IPL28_27065 [Chloroflexi bacterium]|nr:hypothetical protein [Chloroflexota bacterium]